MLTVTIKAITAAYISLSYQVTNTDATDIYVADLLYRIAADGSQSVDPKLGYVMPMADGTLYAGKFLMRIPEGLKVESADVPYFRRLGPGQSLNGEIELPNPARPYHPYVTYQLGETPQPVARIVVQVGVIRAGDLKPDEGTLRQAAQMGPDYFVADYGYGLQYQAFLQSEIQTLQTGAAFYPVLSANQ